MGCWNETCAVTNLPIKEGEGVIMIVFNKSLMTNPDLRNETNHLFQHINVFPADFPLIFRGTYNDYGWINESNKDDLGEEYYLSSIFIKESVYDSVVKEYGKIYPKIEHWQNQIKILPIVWPDISAELKKNFEYNFVGFCYFVSFMMDIRKNIFSGLGFKGYQYSDKKSYNFLISLMKEEIQQY